MRRRSFLQAGMLAAADSGAAQLTNGERFNSGPIDDLSRAAMSNPFPIPRSIRQTDVLVGNGGKIYGPFEFQVFDIEDVVVWSRASTADAFAKDDTVTIAKVSGQPFDYFTIEFATSVPATTDFVVSSERVVERSAGVEMGTMLDLTALQKELSKQATVLQELRRDLDRALKVQFDRPPASIPGPQDNSVLAWHDGKLVNIDLAEFINDAGFATAEQGFKADEAFLAVAVPRNLVADYNIASQTGTDNSAAFLTAAASGKPVYVPAGLYYSNNSQVDRLLEEGVFFGPGRIFSGWLSGRQEEQGKIHAFGVATPARGEIGAGGVLLGGEGENRNGVLLWASSPSSWAAIPKTGGYQEFNLFPRLPVGTGIGRSGTGKIEYTFGTLSYFAEEVQVDDFVGFGLYRYKIASLLPDGFTIKTLSGSPVKFSADQERTWRWVYDVRRGNCNVSGVNVSFLDGDFFWGFFYDQEQNRIKIDGTWYPVVSITDSRSLTINTNLGTLTNVPFVQKTHLEIVTGLRCQSMFGRREENVLFAITDTGEGLIGQNGYVDGNVPREMPLTVEGALSYDGNGRTRHWYLSADGRGGLGEARDVVLSSPARWNVTVVSPAAHGGGANRVIAERLKGGFSNGLRYLDVFFDNDFFGANLQTRTGSGTTSMFIQPEGGGLSVGTKAAKPSGVDLALAGVFGPQTDNTHTLGTAGNRFSTIYAATGIINTSDGRDKADVRESDLGLNFVLAVEPKAFRFRSGGLDLREVEEEYEFDEPLFEDAEIEETQIDIVDGRAVARRVMKTVQSPIYDVFPLFDERGNHMRDVSGRPVYHQVQRTRKAKAIRKVVVEQDRAGLRTHYGFVAQQVKQALDSLGVEDFAGWTLADAGDAESRQGLRLDQFIAPLYTAVRQLSEQLSALETREKGGA